MAKLADKKRMTIEGATSFITSFEIFFVLIMIEFVIIRILPFRISNYVLFGAMITIWYYTNYIMRKSLTKAITDTGIKKEYQLMSKSAQRNYLILSIILFYTVIVALVAIGAITIGGYDKRW